MDFLEPAGLLPPTETETESNSAHGSDDDRRLAFCRWLTVAGSVAVVLSSLLISLWGNAVFEMDKIMQGMFGGPLLGLFLLGLFTTRGTAGVMCSCLLMGVIVVTSVLCPTPEPAAVAIAAASAAVGSAEVAAGIGGSSSCGSSGVLSWLGRLSFFWYPVIGSAVSFTVGWLASRPWEGHARAVQNLVVVLRRHYRSHAHRWRR